jgi:signal transduction histidine kinase
VYKADSLSEAISFLKGQVRSKLALARYQHITLQDYKKAIAFTREAETLLGENKSSYYLPEVNRSMGMAFHRLGIQDSAFAYLKEAEKHYLDQGRTYDVWEAYEGLAKVAIIVQDFDKLSFYTQKAYEAVKDGNSRMDIGYTLFQAINGTMISRDLKAHNSLLEEWHHFKSDGDVNYQVGTTPNHAIVALLMDNDVEMVDRVIEAYHLALNDEDFLIAGLQAGNLAEYWKKTENIEKTIEWLRKSADAYQMGDLQYANKLAMESLYHLYKKQDQTALALQALEEFTALEDSLQQIETLEQIRELEIRFDTERKEVALFERTKQRNLLLVSSVVLGLLAIAILILLSNRLKINRKLAAQQAALQSTEIRHLKQEIQLKAYEAMIEGQEAERSRIAKDLHDSVGGSLASVKAYVQATEDKKDESEKAVLFSQTAQLIDRTTEEVRRISHNLLPRNLELTGLTQSVKDLCGDMKRQGITCELEIHGSEYEPLLASPVMIYRVLQELLHNIVKHAQAKQVLVQLLFSENELEILVEDDGKGFDYEHAIKADGLGLNSILSRVEFMQGLLDIDSVMGEGTTVNISVPLTGEKVI